MLQKQEGQLKLFTFRSEEQQVELYEHELKFLQNCLHVNPKSYGVWEHRRFSLRNMPNPDWKRDLKLCNQFLTFDPRNCKSFLKKMKLLFKCDNLFSNLSSQIMHSLATNAIKVMDELEGDLMYTLHWIAEMRMKLNDSMMPTSLDVLEG